MFLFCLGVLRLFSCRFWVSTLALLLGGLSLSAQQPKVLAPHKPVPPAIAGPQPLHGSPVPRSLIGGPWMTDGGMKSYLHITNDLVTSPLSIAPILWLSNGTKLALPPVDLAPSGTAVISINQALADKGIAPYATLSGYVEIDYQWPWPALCATVRNVDVAHSVIFNYSLPLSLPVWTPQAMSGTHNPTSVPSLGSIQDLEGLWWKQESNVTGFVAFINPGDSAVPATLTALDAQGKSMGNDNVVVSPHGTKIVSITALPRIAGASGGLRVQYQGRPNDLLVSGGLRDDATGYSANIGFAAPPSAPATQSSTVSYAQLGLMTGTADPMLSFPAGTVFTPYAVARNISSKPLVVTPNLWWMSAGTARSATLPQVTFAPNQATNLNVPALLAQAGLTHYNGSVNLVLDVAANAAGGALLLSSGSVDQTNNYVFQVVPKAVKESIAANLSYWSVANGDDTMVTLWNPADEAQDFVFTLFYAGGHYFYPIHIEPRATTMFNVSEILHTTIPDTEGNVVPAGISEGSAELTGSQGEAQHILVSFDAATYNVIKATCGTHCVTCQGAVNSWVTDSPFAVPVSGTHNLAYTWQSHSGMQYNDTAYASWSSTNTSIANLGNGTSAGIVSGVAAGSVTAEVLDDNVPDYATSCFPQGVTIDCPLLTGVQGSSPGKAILPASLKVLSVNLISMSYLQSCPDAAPGIAIEIKYQILDQTGANMTTPNMEPQEKILNEVVDKIARGNPEPNWTDIYNPAYPGSSLYADANGQFLDAPFGTCFAGISGFVETFSQPISIKLDNINFIVRTNNWTTSSTGPGQGTITNGPTAPNDISKSRP